MRGERKQCTVLCQGMREEKIVHCSLSRDKRRLKSIKRENNALFFVFFVKGRKEIEVNKKRKQCTVLCQGMCTVLCQGTRGDRSIKKENNALFFVKGREKTKVNKRRKQ